MKPYWIIRHHGSTSIRSLSSSFQSSNLLAAGDDSGQVSLIDLSTLRPRFQFQAQTDSILTVLILSRTSLLTHARDNKLKIWRLPSSLPSFGTTQPKDVEPECVRNIGVNALNFSKCSHHNGLVAVPNALDAAYIDISDLNNGIRLHEAIGRPDIKPSANRLPIVMSLHLQTDAVIAGYEDGWIKQWSLKGELIWQQRCHSESLMAMHISEKHGWGVSVGADDRLARFNLDGRGEVKLVKTKKAGNASVVIAPDGKTCAVGGWDGSIRVFNTEIGEMQELGSLDYHRDTVECLTFAYAKTRGIDDDDDEEEEEGEDAVETGHLAPPGTELILAAGGRDGKISLWKYH